MQIALVAAIPLRVLFYKREQRRRGGAHRLETAAVDRMAREGAGFSRCIRFDGDMPATPREHTRTYFLGKLARSWS